MNAIPLHPERDELAPASIIVERLKLIRGDKKQTDELAKAVGWSNDMAEKICAGTTGVVAERTKEYMDYLARGNVIGSNCHCARANMGECGRR
ncbi:hypothetical protein [Burkholderia gladioli]|uniref:hypothetical protein n=1 Tax=Burkholderia gladioli TaxID=28095 RepID=UPI0034DB0A35